ncbi:MAG: N-acetylglutaminylglutamine amidotransferase [Firmicutes bacterium]|nr:N-acetylglutaminylglutamine amidotransferase [Bacillota bacterium]
MCGIAGEVRFQCEVNLQNVENMLTALAPRGPDAKGIMGNQRVCLGHRRLSVIDLSQHANQPMHDPKLGLTLVFNGCIYNYRELREELESLGHEFFSTSDSEVIIKAFYQWQASCVKRFSGMFAFAIWQRDSGEVFFARDRLGIKPLYYHFNEHGFWFASTLPALLKSGFVPTNVNPQGLHQYMSMRAIVGSGTLLDKVYKLEPGHWMTLSANGELNIQRYWQLDANIDTSADEQAWKERIKHALFTSVERRLEADVPVGVLLSGGVDSSLVVGMLAELGQHHIHTFSIGFEDVGEEAGNEFKYSDLIAQHYNTDHHRIYAQHCELLTHLAPCVQAMSEPMVSHDVIGFYLLSKQVSQHVKVVQSGQGADEVFGGYHWYQPLAQASTENAAQAYATHYFSWSQTELDKVLAPRYRGTQHALDYVTAYFDDCAALSTVDKALHIDTCAMVVDDPVKRVDNMTMAFGLEARVPFLDHELVELAAQMPAELKLKDGGKYLLKEVAREIIPSAVIDRPKGYFPVPALRNMQGEYLALAREVFNRPHARERGIFDMQYIDRMLDNPGAFNGPFGSRLWQVTLLEMWLTEHNIDVHHSSVRANGG